MNDHIPSSSSAVSLFADGACGPTNPGPMAAGVVILNEEHEEIHTISARLPDGTNNLAEYHALILGLEWCATHHRTPVTIFMDSQLVVYQCQGTYACNSPHLLPLRDRAQQLMRELHATITWIPREQNERADELSKLGLQRAPILTLTPELRAACQASLNFFNPEIPATPPAIRALLTATTTAEPTQLADLLLDFRSRRDHYTALTANALRAAAVLRHGSSALAALDTALEQRSSRTKTNALRAAARGLPVELAIALVNLQKAARKPYLR